MNEKIQDIEITKDEQLSQDRIRAINKIKTLGSDDESVKGKMTLMKIVGGDILTGRMIKGHFGIILLISFFFIIQISNRYSSDYELQKIDNLQKTLKDAKYSALWSESQLTKNFRQGRVMEILKNNNDTSLHALVTPLYKVEVNE